MRFSSIKYEIEPNDDLFPLRSDEIDEAPEKIDSDPDPIESKLWPAKVRGGVDTEPGALALALEWPDVGGCAAECSSINRGRSLS